MTNISICDNVSMLTIKVSVLTFFVSMNRGEETYDEPACSEAGKGGGLHMDKEKSKSIAFTLRVIHNQIKAVIHKSFPRDGNAPQSQLQGGILGYLYHHLDEPVYQRDLEKEFRISRATATNTLQVMEKNGLIVRKSQDKDARLKRIVMTESAREKHAKVEEHMRFMDKRMLQGMTEAEISEFYRLLGKLLDNLEQMEAECGIENKETALEDCP